jgi:hypothetical protein
MNQVVISEKTNDDISLRNAAVITGIALFIMAIMAPIANFSILQKLIVPGDAETTLSNVITEGGSFRVATALFLIVALLDILVAWGLYIFLKPVNKSLSLLTAWLRVVYATMLGVVTISLVNVIQLTDGGGLAILPDTGDLHGLVMQSLMRFDYGWEFSLIIFGFHLLILGFLVFKAGYMKRILGILLLIAALGYLIDGFGRLLSPGYGTGISVYTFIGEIVLIFWLLIAGGRDKATN